MAAKGSSESRLGTIRVLRSRIDASEVKKFLQQSASDATPAPIGATASVKIAVWGKVTCDPDGQPWRYDITIWGGPAYFGDSIGFMYTAYDSWDAFFQNVTSVHCQGIAEAGGILQINWFNGNGGRLEVQGGRRTSSAVRSNGRHCTDRNCLTRRSGPPRADRALAGDRQAATDRPLWRHVWHYRGARTAAGRAIL